MVPAGHDRALLTAAPAYLAHPHGAAWMVPIYYLRGPPDRRSLAWHGSCYIARPLVEGLTPAWTCSTIRTNHCLDITINDSLYEPLS